MPEYDTSGNFDALRNLVQHQGAPRPPEAAPPARREESPPPVEAPEYGSADGATPAAWNRYEQIRPRISGAPDVDEVGANAYTGPDPAVAEDPLEAKMRALRIAFKDDPQTLQVMLEQVRQQHQPEAMEPEPEAGPEHVEPRTSAWASRGWRGVLTRMGLHVKKGRAEVKADLLAHAHRVIAASSLTYPVVIGVSSFKGGCGKSSTAVMVARAVSRIRATAPLVLDTDLHGTLLARAVDTARQESANRGHMKILAHHLAHSDPVRHSELVRYNVRDAGGGVFVLPGNEQYKAANLTADEYLRVLDAASPLFDVIVVDMSVVADTVLYKKVLRSLTALIMVTPPNEDSAGFTYLTKKTLKDYGADHLNRRRITLINHTSNTESNVDTHALAKSLKLSDDMHVMETPWDKHLSLSSTIDIHQVGDEAGASFEQTLAALIDTISKTNSA